jgi:hypothetical protein
MNKVTIEPAYTYTYTRDGIVFTTPSVDVAIHRTDDAVECYEDGKLIDVFIKKVA